jgi:hypothetical protein
MRVEMSGVDIDHLLRNVEEAGNWREVVTRAAGVANAIHAGIGGMIKDTLMESDLRLALGLFAGELVNIPKGFEPQREVQP